MENAKTYTSAEFYVRLGILLFVFALGSLLTAPIWYKLGQIHELDLQIQKIEMRLKIQEMN